MTVSRWDPFRDLVALQERMNRLFDDSLRGKRFEEDLSAGVWSPAVDVLEIPEALLLKIDLPEVKKEDISIQLEGNVLSVRGERRTDSDQEQTFHRRERPHGRFQRAFTLPAEVDGEKVEARFSEGVLTVRLEKKSQSQPRQIQIR